MRSIHAAKVVGAGVLCISTLALLLSAGYLLRANNGARAGAILNDSTAQAALLGIAAAVLLALAGALLLRKPTGREAARRDISPQQIAPGTAAEEDI